jgi:hypothetical protein
MLSRRTDNPDVQEPDEVADRSTGMASDLTMGARRPRTWPRVALLAVSAALTACTGQSSTGQPTASQPTSSSSVTSRPAAVTTKPTATVGTPVATTGSLVSTGFNDHTVARIASVAEFNALAATDGTGRFAVKFVIADPFGDAPQTFFYDSRFYTLHDQWYWFRLLNGQPIPGATDDPVTGLSFTSIDEVTTWARRQIARGPLPLDLGFSGDRLYSKRFYDDSIFNDPKRFDVGTIVGFADRRSAGGTRWLLELEHVERVTPESLQRYMNNLRRILPADIANQLSWVVRSPVQDETAQRIERARLPFHDRIVRYSELVAPGTEEVYSEGIAVGRLHYIGPDDDDTDLSAIRPDDILITEHAPDWLPPARAVITSDPQTPLAHINLLARNRGIPNGSIAGIHRHAGVRRAADVKARAIVVASGSSITISLLTPDQAAEAMKIVEPGSASVPAVDAQAIPYTVDLTELAARLRRDGLAESGLDRWRPIIGGKSSGMTVLLATPGLTPPPTPVAITVRAYTEHIASLRNTVQEAVTDPTVRSDPRARWLTLEGRAGYEERFALEADKDFAEQFRKDNPRGTPIGDVLAAGGVRSMVERKPIKATTLSEITDVLHQRFGTDHPKVGLRFRSSSSVEDIEGFNGAGLYTSVTGFLDPAAQKESNRSKTVERAILEAWGSYWGAEAFGERELAGIDHLSGAMGLTVHARFTDDLERNNGVATFTFDPGTPTSRGAVLEINVQRGPTPVTNPDPNVKDRPEVVRIRRGNDDSITIERVASSSLSPGQAVMNDAAARELFDQTAAVADIWRNGINSELDARRKLSTVSLDFEFKTMEEGWPRTSEIELPPARLVVRQVRSLDPGLGHLAPELRALPVPRDVLMRAARIVGVYCGTEPHSSDSESDLIEVYTDPLRAPDMGHAQEPLVVGASSSIRRSDCRRVDLHRSVAERLRAFADDPDAMVLVP